jgi:hypothetical protein
MIRNQYLFPGIDDFFDKMKGAMVFSNIDWRSSYHQFQIKEGDIPKTAFKTRFRHYEFTIFPLGRTNTPGVFKSLMNGAFHKYLDKFVQLFIDETLIYSRTMEEHEQHLSLLLQCLGEHKLWETVEILSRIHYLGHVMSGEGIAVDSKKVEDIIECPVPTNVP